MTKSYTKPLKKNSFIFPDTFKEVKEEADKNKPQNKTKQKCLVTPIITNLHRNGWFCTRGSRRIQLTRINIYLDTPEIRNQKYAVKNVKSFKRPVL